MSSPVVILDLDNCVANDAWRIPFIDWSQQDPDARYHPYHMGAYYDENDNDWFESRCRQEFGRGVLEADFRLFVLTARSGRYRTLTELWLKEHMTFQPEAVLMRDPGDHRHSAALKEAQLGWLTDPNMWGVRVEDIAFAADDRQDVLDMYIRNGVRTTVRHAIHDVCAYTPPKLSVPDILRNGAATYEQRNKLYGDNYKHFGHAMRGVFPAGLTVETVEDWNRLGLLVQCAAKLTRYGQSFGKGGHVDSAHDLAVYAAMLQELST